MREQIARAHLMFEPCQSCFSPTCLRNKQGFALETADTLDRVETNYHNSFNFHSILLALAEREIDLPSSVCPFLYSFFTGCVRIDGEKRDFHREKNHFLDATSHLYKRSCPSVGPSVGPSFRTSVAQSVCWFRVSFGRG